MMQRRTMLGQTVLGLAGAAVAAPALALAQGKRFLANDYGAKADGTTINTRAIQAAIDAAAKVGGTVAFKPGAYRTGSIFVKSGVTLLIEKGVTVLGSTNLADYPEMFTRAADIEMNWPSGLINVYDQQNVRILGDGIIDGDGKVFWDSYWALRRQYEPKGIRWAADFDCRRPRLIQIFRSSNVELAGPRLHRPGFWTVHVCYSDRVKLADLLIYTNEGGRGPSTDGIDIDSCSNILVERLDVSCNDDALCLKAGRGVDGFRVNRPSRDIVVRDCVVRDAHGGISFGSGTTGGFHNVTFENIDIRFPVPVGILFKSALGRGGHIHDIDIRKVRMHHVPVAMRILPNWYPAYSTVTIPPEISPVPEHWKLLAAPVLPREKGMVKITDVRLKDIRAVGAKTAFEVEGFPEVPIERFTFEDVYLDAQSAGFIRNARDWRFIRSQIDAVDRKPVEFGATSGMIGI